MAGLLWKLAFVFGPVLVDRGDLLDSVVLQDSLALMNGVVPVDASDLLDSVDLLDAWTFWTP